MCADAHARANDYSARATRLPAVLQCQTGSRMHANACTVCTVCTVCVVYAVDSVRSLSGLAFSDERGGLDIDAAYARTKCFAVWCVFLSGGEVNPFFLDEA